MQENNGAHGAHDNDQYIFQDGNRYSVYICKPIVAPSRYIELFNLLQTATKDDHIDFFLATPGGRLDTTAQLLAMMADTEAETTCHVMSSVMSAGTMIALAADHLTVAPFGYMMIHNASGGTGYDKVNLTAQYAVHSEKWCKNIFKEIYAVFLSEEEIEQLLGNRDFYIDHDEILERWERVLEARVAMEQEILREEELEQANLVNDALATIKEQIKQEILEELTRPNQV